MNGQVKKQAILGEEEHEPNCGEGKAQTGFLD